MKKILLVTFALMVVATWSFAAPFAPTPLEISVQDEIIYPFDGTDVDFTFDVSGKPARCWLFINTKLPEAELPEQVTNGFLGWHYVNRIDTTVYISGAYTFSAGTGHTITWDGKGNENTSGGAYGGTYEKFDNVAPGTYDYYIWAYDDQSPRVPVCNFLQMNFFWWPQYSRFAEFDEAGLPLATPLIWGNVCFDWRSLHANSNTDPTEPAEGFNSYGPPEYTAFKFPLGSDPDDMAALQTSFMPGFYRGTTVNDEGETVPDGSTGLDASPIVFDPTDHDIFYNLHVFTAQKFGALFKWNWITDGTAEIVEDWGGWDDLSFVTASRRGYGEYMPALTTDTNYIMITSPGRNPYEIQHDVLYIVDFDGNKAIDGQMLDDFYHPDTANETSTNGMVNRAFACREVPYWITMGGEQTCITQVADASRLAAGEGDDEYIVWTNKNGDYFHDSAWDPVLSTYPWDCSSGAYRNINGARRDEAFFDSEGVHIMFPMYQGLSSILVYTHDGSGVSYAKFADDTVGSDANKKGSGQRVDNGGTFDGIYLGDVVSDDVGSTGQDHQNTKYVAFDSASGVITSFESVEEEGQEAFSVDAAYPNPANPTTTIGFTLAEAGHVTVDIYNVAGQKVDTLVNDEMNAGKHSIVWNGSGFSAGVYFYTVKSGNFSKTMKVTLLK